MGDGSGNVLETGNLDNSAQLQNLVGLANHFNKHFGEHFGTPMTPHEPSKENDSKKSEEQEPPKEDSKKEDLDDFVELTKDAKAKTSKANSPGEVLKELDEEIQGEILRTRKKLPRRM